MLQLKKNNREERNAGVDRNVSRQNTMRSIREPKRFPINIGFPMRLIGSKVSR